MSGIFAILIDVYLILVEYIGSMYPTVEAVSSQKSHPIIIVHFSLPLKYTNPKKTQLNIKLDYIQPLQISFDIKLKELRLEKSVNRQKQTLSKIIFLK